MLNTKFSDKYRYQMAFLMFVLWVLVYWQRVNVTILLVDNAFLVDMGLVGESAKQGLLMTVFLISYSLSNILGAPLGDWIGPRKTMLFAMMVSSLAMLLGGLAAGLMTVLAARLILGIGQGVYYPTQSILVKKWFPLAERGKANAIYGIGCIGPVLAMPVFTFLLANYSWRSIFYLVAGLGVIGLLPVLKGFITDSPETNRFMTNSEKRYIQKNSPGEETVQKTSALQGIKLIITSGNYWLLSISYIAFLSIWWGVVTWVPQYLMVARGFSLQSMGFMAAAPYASAALGVLLGGALSDRFSRRAVFGAVALLGAAFCILTAALVDSRIIAAFFIIIAPVFCEMYYAPVWVILQSLLPDHLVGTGSGFMNGFSNLIAAMSPLIMGVLIDLTNSYNAGLFYLTILGIVGASCSIILMRKNL